MMDGSLREDGKTPADYDYNVRVTQQTMAFAHAAACPWKASWAAWVPWKPAWPAGKTASARKACWTTAC